MEGAGDVFLTMNATNQSSDSVMILDELVSENALDDSGIENVYLVLDAQ